MEHCFLKIAKKSLLVDPVQLSSAVSLIRPPLTAADDVGLEVLLDAVAVVEHASAVAAVAAYSVFDVLRRGRGRRGSRRPLHLVRVAVRPDMADEVVLQLVNVLGGLLHDLGLGGERGDGQDIGSTDAPKV